MLNRKQLIGLIVAGCVFVGVCTMSFLTNVVGKMIMEKNAPTSLMTKSAVSNLPTSDYVGIIDVDGVIMDMGTAPMAAQSTYNHTATLNLIDEYMNSKKNKGILLTVNTPGGGVYESDELYLKLMEYKETTGRPVWAYMKSQACSGGYYISMAADKIGANRNCWTGSLGVIISMTNIKGLYDKLGIKQESIVSGKNKTMGSGVDDMTQEQKAIFQSVVDESYNQFIDVITKGRKMSVEEIKPLADGRIYTAQQAKDLKLIDDVIAFDEYKDKIDEELGGEIEFYTPEKPTNIFAQIFSMINKTKEKSEAEILTEFIEKKGSEVPMYYAQ